MINLSRTALPPVTLKVILALNASLTSLHFNIMFNTTFLMILLMAYGCAFPFELQLLTYLSNDIVEEGRQRKHEGPEQRRRRLAHPGRRH